MSLVYIFAAILMFGILITVHEAGHFFAARLNKIPVREFAIGFGPKLLKWKSKKHETDFSLRLIPMGGFCAFYGEDDGSEAAKDDPRFFGNFSALKRLSVIIAGPIMNIVLAFVVAIAFFVMSGIPTISGPATTTTQAVNANSPAELAGIQADDAFVSINGIKVTDNVSELINKAMEEGQSSIEVEIDRPGTGLKTVEVSPLFDQGAKRYMLGISLITTMPQEWHTGSFGEIISSAFDLCVQVSTGIFRVLGDLIFRGQGLNDLTGFVGVTETIVKTTQASQLPGYLYLMCMISINLGVFNILPIPGLDGSRIIFLLIEAIRGKPFKREGYVHAFGMILLFALMIWVNFRDVMRLF
ncbi:MAG: hypothetical protein GX858_05720 [Clostridiales bacterium]|nr:hypothetical protein [Clostridiales bacterium]